MDTSPKKSEHSLPALAAPDRTFSSTRRSSSRSPVSLELRRPSTDLVDSFSALSTHNTPPLPQSPSFQSTELNHLLPTQALALKTLASINSVSVTDPTVWPALLLGSKYPASFSAHDAANTLEIAMLNVSLELAANSIRSHNFGKLISHLLSQLQLLKESLKLSSTAPIPAPTYNALVLTRVFVKHFACHLTNDDIATLFEYHPSSTLDRNASLPTTSDPEKLPILPPVEVEDRPKVDQLLDAILSLLINMDANATYLIYEFYVELLNMLFVLFSTQLYRPLITDNNCFLDCVMRKYSSRADAVVAKLLENIIEQRPPPTQSSSLVVNAYNYLFSPQAAFFTDSFPVADRSLHLLLLLSTQPKHMGVSRELWGDAYRTAITCLRDHNVLASDLEGRDRKMHLISFKGLFQIFSSSLDTEENMLLFYLLLIENSPFRVFVLSRSDPEIIYKPILRMIYESMDAKSADAKVNFHQIYILLTILLILSQDDMNNETIQKITVDNLTWFTERPLLKSISLGGLAFLVLIRTMQQNLSHQKDVYLHTTCLAILVNMSSSMLDMHAYVAQRIISLFELLSRRQLKSTIAPHAPGAEIGIAAYEDVLVLALEMIHSVLSQRLKHNAQLVYALLLDRDLFVPYRDKPRFIELVAMLETVIDYFSQRVSEANLKSPSTNEVLSLIEQAARTWTTKEIETSEVPLKFQYEEEPDAHEFFVPYVWALVYRQPFIHWSDTKALVLDAYRHLNSEGE